MTERLDRDRLNCFIRRFWIAFGVMIVGICFAGWGWVERTNNQVEDAQRITNDRLELAQRNICERLRLVRSNTNRNGYAIHEGLRAVADLPSLRASPSARRALGRLEEIPRYQAQVDCDEVIERPRTYVAPRPVPIRRMTPQQREAILENGRANP